MALFRRANVNDIACIMEILADGRLSLSALGIDQWQGYYPSEDLIRKDIEEGSSYVVENDEGLLTATVMVGFKGEEDYLIIKDGAWLTDSPIEQPSYAVIHRMAVTRSNQGSGLAGAILKEAERLAISEGCESIRIDTHPGNIPMMRLLEKNGYTCCGVIFIDHAEGSTPERFAFEKLMVPVAEMDIVSVGG